MSLPPHDPNTAVPALTPAPGQRDRDLIQLHEFADGSREVRPDDEHHTGQAPPEEVGDESADADGVADTTRGDSGGAS